MSVFTLRQVRSGPVYRTLPAWGWWIVGTGVVIGLFSAQPLLLVAVWLLVPVLVRLLWRQSEPPVLLFAALMLWLFSSTQALYYAGYRSIPLDQVFGGIDLGTATWLSLLGTLALASGMRLGVAGMPSLSADRLRREVTGFPIPKLFIAYLLSYVAISVLGASAAFGVPRLSQFVFAFYNVRWALFFLLIYTVLTQRTEYRYLVLAVLIEITVGFLGFWGAFKDFFFVFAVAFVAARPRFTTRQALAGGALAALVLFLGLFWTVIKPEYRQFLSQGTETQTVRVPVSARIGKLESLIATTDAQDFGEGIEPVVNRVGYVYYFAHTISYVPENVPYEGGARWGKAIMHVLRPRLFFPNKPAIHDSEVTNKYTALNVAGRQEGTSINLGYFAESYVDFGPWGMFIPIFLVGIFFGLIYRYFVQAQPHIIGLALVSAVLVFGASGLPSTPKLLGRNIVNTVVMVVVLKFAAPYFLDWVRRSPS